MIEEAIRVVLSKGIKTRDLGGTAGTKQFGEAILHDAVFTWLRAGIG